MKKLLLLATICLPSLTLQATPISFPTGLVPFQSIISETPPAANGDVLVLGYTTAALWPALNLLPLPASPNETFGDVSIELAPGEFFSNVFVPTSAQRFGDYSAFPKPLVDPLSGIPFVANIIPSYRLFGDGGLYAFEAGPQSTAAPEPSALTLTFAAGLFAVLILAARRLRVI